MFKNVIKNSIKTIIKKPVLAAKLDHFLLHLPPRPVSLFMPRFVATRIAIATVVTIALSQFASAAWASTDVVSQVDSVVVYP